MTWKPTMHRHMNEHARRAESWPAAQPRRRKRGRRAGRLVRRRGRSAGDRRCDSGEDTSACCDGDVIAALEGHRLAMPAGAPPADAIETAENHCLATPVGGPSANPEEIDDGLELPPLMPTSYVQGPVVAARHASDDGGRTWRLVPCFEPWTGQPAPDVEWWYEAPVLYCQEGDVESTRRA